MLLTQGATARLVLGAVILYLAAHGLTGRQGLLAFVELQERERALQAEQADLADAIDRLEDRAGRLRSDSPDFDRDYLEERARAVLNAVRADEIVLSLAALEGQGQTAGQP
ncbi:MAG: septum formation initiator family protein [Hyphomonadaceae bacterium]|nr:septum formation initiator family protein [Hyphomonadaceae bacterium]